MQEHQRPHRPEDAEESPGASAHGAPEEPVRTFSLGSLLGRSPQDKCTTCGSLVPAAQDHCLRCGARVSPTERTVVMSREPALHQERRPSPAMAGFLSFLLPGLGQLYLGQVGKGLLFLALLLFSPFTAGLSHLALLIYAVIEAYSLAKRRRAGEPVSPWGTLWDPTWQPFGR